MFGLLGDSGLKIQIEIHPNPQSIASKTVVALDHYPSWKVTKNPFIAGLHKKALVSNTNTAPHQMNMNMGNPPMQPYSNTQQAIMGGYGAQHEVIYAYGENEDVQGVVHLVLPPGKKFEHLGIKIQFVGRIDMVSLDDSFCY